MEIMATVKEKIDALAQMYNEVNERAKPLLAELQPYLDVAREAERLGLSADSTAEEIIDAFAGKLDLSIPAPTIVPQVLSAGAPQQIREAGESLNAASRTIGALVGQVAGIVLGLK
jgi:hypothetical protein